MRLDNTRVLSLLLKWGPQWPAQLVGGSPRTDNYNDVAGSIPYSYALLIQIVQGLGASMLGPRVYTASSGSKSMGQEWF